MMREERDNVWGADPVLPSNLEARTGGEPDEPEEIRVEIEQTRVEMSETIDAIQQKLNPATLAEQAKEAVRDATVGKAERMISNAGETAGSFGGGLVETIRRNPIPAALAGLSLGWLFMQSRKEMTRRDFSYRAYSGPERRYDSARFYGGTERRADWRDTRYRGIEDDGRNLAGEARDRAGQVAGQVRETAGQARDRAAELAGQVQEGVGEFADRAQETAGDLASEARYRARRAQYWFDDTLRENPLAVGVAALAIGSAVALALPTTRRENEFMGEARDNLMERAGSVAQDTVEKVQRVAEKAGEAVKQETRDQGLTA
jgi:hypothetical protein